MNNTFKIKGKAHCPFNSIFMRSKFLLLYAFLCTAIFCLAAIPASYALPQRSADITVYGTVTSSDGETLPGVSIGVKGTAVGAVTDAQGRYRITVPENAVLVVAYIGFKKQFESPDPSLGQAILIS